MKYLGSGLITRDDRKFAEYVLHYRPYSSRATRSGVISLGANYVPSPNHSYQLAMQPNDRVICCEAPDGIQPTADSRVFARYADSGVCAGVAYRNQIVVMPFMPESITESRILLEENYLLKCKIL